MIDLDSWLMLTHDIEMREKTHTAHLWLLKWEMRRKTQNYHLGSFIECEIRTLQWFTLVLFTYITYNFWHHIVWLYFFFGNVAVSKFASLSSYSSTFGGYASFFFNFIVLLILLLRNGISFLFVCKILYDSFIDSVCEQNNIVNFLQQPSSMWTIV